MGLPAQDAEIYRASRIAIGRASYDWPDKDVATLTNMWDQDFSARDIAKAIGNGVSRCAVIGKARRMGLKEKGRGYLPQNGAPKRIKKFLKPKPRPYVKEPFYGLIEPLPPERIEDHNIPQEQRRTLLELTDETCRWPVGEPGSAQFFFCGAEPVPHMPYCAGHCLIAYQKAPRLSDDERQARRFRLMRHGKATTGIPNFIVEDTEAA